MTNRSLFWLAEMLEKEANRCAELGIPMDPEYVAQEAASMKHVAATNSNKLNNSARTDRVSDHRLVMEECADDLATYDEALRYDDWMRENHPEMCVDD